MNVHLRMLGCRLNQSEIDRMARDFQQRGHVIVDDPALADHIVVNTCAVTIDAERDSRKLIRQLHRANTGAAITITGCYAHLSAEAVGELPGVARVIDNHAKDRLVELITGESSELFDREPLERDTHIARTRAFVKVQDGCDNACTFCITTVARGAGRSRPIRDVVDEINDLVSQGYQEAVLTGVHLGSYGHDYNDADGLAHLVAAILANTDLPRLRLSSLEPWDIAPDFFDLWANPRLLPHLHLPLQSGCDRTLKRMLRRTTQADFRELMRAARERIADPCITSDIIVGFPGETDAEFAESRAFVEAMDFAGLHVFRYSKRPGTAAARMKGHLPESLKKERSAAMIALSEAGGRSYAARHVGVTRPVMWEHVAGANEDGFLNVGYTDNYIRVTCVHPRALTGEVFPTMLMEFDPALQQMRGMISDSVLVQG